MSIGSQSQALIRLLQQVQGEMIRHPAFARGAGATVDDPGYHSNIDAIDQLAAKLSAISAQIQRLYATTRFHEQIAQRTPKGKKGPDMRWQKFRQQQSARDKRKEVDKAYQLSVDVLEQLRDLRQRNNRPPIEDIIVNALGDLSKDAQEAVKIVEHHKGHLDKIDAHPSIVGNVPLPLIIALIAIYLKLRDR